MQTLYVIEPGSSLRKEGDCLKIVQGRRVLDTIPAAGLKQLTLAGRASISGAVLDFLVEHNIDTVFMTMNGRFRARLLLDDSGHTALRRHQYLRLSDPAYQQRVAAAIVRQKLDNQSRLLLRLQSLPGLRLLLKLRSRLLRWERKGLVRRPSLSLACSLLPSRFCRLLPWRVEGSRLLLA